jgi:protein TonB
MGQAALLEPPPTANRTRPKRTEPEPAALPPVAFRFESLVLTEAHSLARGRSATLIISIAAHSLLVLALIVVPLFVEEILPAPDAAVRAFFVTPVVAAPPPPPPPPPAAGVRPAPRTPVAPHPEEPAKFLAPIETPAEVRPEEGIDLGVEGGVPGGVEGGVPGGVVGGVVGGLPQEAPPPPRAVRVGGQLKVPQLVHRVDPEYPELARAARLSAILIMEATVAASGKVQEVTVLRGAPLFDEPAVAAVKQWVYRPLLLNGVPTPFVLTVTLKFTFKPGTGSGGGR